MIDGVAGGDVGQQGLGRADIAGGLLAADVLFARLQGEAQSGMAGRISGDADQSARNQPFTGFSRGKKCGVRAAVPHGHAESLRAAHRHVRAKFSRRPQPRQRQQIRRHHQQGARTMDLLGEPFIVENGAVGGWILNQRAEDCFVAWKRVMIAHDHFDSQGPGAGLHDLDGLRMAGSRDKKDAALRPDILAQVHRFGGGGGLVEQGSIGDGQAGQIAGHGLEIEQRLQAALGNLRLVRGVLGVPARIFQEVSLDDRRGDAIGVSHADEGVKDLVFPRDGAQFVQRVMLPQTGGKLEGLGQADGRRDHGVNQPIEGGEAQFVQHLRRLTGVGTDVSMHKLIRRLQRWGESVSGRKCREFRHKANLN